MSQVMLIWFLTAAAICSARPINSDLSRVRHLVAPTKESIAHSRFVRNAYARKGGLETDRHEIAVHAQDPGHIRDTNSTRRDHSSIANGQLPMTTTINLQQMTPPQRDKIAPTTTATTPPEKASASLPQSAVTHESLDPPNGCSVVTKTKKITYSKGCTTRVELGVCEGYCPTRVHLRKTYPFIEPHYSVCLMHTFDLVNVTIPCRSQKASERARASGKDIVVTLPNATSCACTRLVTAH